MMKLLAIVGLLLAGVLVTLWAGFAVRVRPFQAPEAATLSWAPIPDGLPEPVERYLRAMTPDGLSVPEVARIEYVGTGSARPFGVWLPIRHRATIEPGVSMFRVMEFPWFGATLIHAEDTYLDGHGKTDLSGLVTGETIGPRTDQGAYLALAAESILVPSWGALDAVWEAVGPDQAALLLPFRGERERLVVTFDPDSALPTRIEADRYKSEDGDKVRWWIDLHGYRVSAQGLMVPAAFDVGWSDEAGPWSRWTIDRMVVASSMR